jgi:FkbM family methyltransferase
MNILRFLKKCLSDPPAAIISAKLVLRSLYAKFWWTIYPDKPLVHKLLEGGKLYLWKGHSFTKCFYPGVDTYESDVRSLMKQILKTNSTFIDVGANIGYYSVIAKQLVGRSGKVISIEPNPETYKMLELNTSQNSVGTPIQCAISQEHGEVELFVPISGDIWASLNHNVFPEGQATTRFKVTSWPLDDLIEEMAVDRVDLIKIDIEGGEFNVLLSAKQIISKHRPVVIIEYSTKTWPAFGASPDAMKQFLKNYEYRVFQFDTARNVLKVPNEPEIWLSEYVNLILYPSERINEN